MESISAEVLFSCLKGEKQTVNKKASLKDFSTEQLVNELAARDGVDTTIAEPYENIVVTVNGPAIVLKITD